MARLLWCESLKWSKVPVACEEGLGTSRESGWELTSTHRDGPFTTIIKNKALGSDKRGIKLQLHPLSRHVILSESRSHTELQFPKLQNEVDVINKCDNVCQVFGDS